MEFWIKDRACINVLGGSIETAKDVYEAANEVSIPIEPLGAFTKSAFSSGV